MRRHVHTILGGPNFMQPAVRGFQGIYAVKGGDQSPL